MNDRYEVLSADSYGFVAMCKSCGQLDIGFGTVIIRLGVQETVGFKNKLRNSLNEISKLTQQDEKSIYFSTDSLAIRLALSYRETKHLHELLSKALFVYQSLKILCENEE